ncbi:MAG: RIP metalloprotease RseP, partial [Acetobacteraceae bacterium]|nr:RIP metalloprotease RseP [Acetobacteraceae bacterium]
MPEPFRSIAAFLVVLGVLIFIHELGHYLAARWRGVHVERFSIGFGRAIYAWTDKRGCEWRIGWLPL